MFIDPAFAQGAPAAGPDPFTGLLIPMLLMVLIFYFLVIRPQSQRAAQHKELVEKVRLRVRILRSTLMDVRAKGEPVKETT